MSITIISLVGVGLAFATNSFVRQKTNWKYELKMWLDFPVMTLSIPYNFIKLASIQSPLIQHQFSVYERLHALKSFFLLSNNIFRTLYFYKWNYEFVFATNLRFPTSTSSRSGKFGYGNLKWSLSTLKLYVSTYVVSLNFSS